MARLIDADELFKAVNQYPFELKIPRYMSDWANKLVGAVVSDMCDIIQETPSVDAQPVVHGRWEPEDNIFDDSTWICSACHEPWVLIEGTPHDNNMNYCPNCGAKMDLEV